MTLNLESQLSAKSPGLEAIFEVEGDLMPTLQPFVKRPAAFSRFYHGTKPSAASLIPNQSTLWRFLGTNWLSTTDENDMLELLRERVAGDPELVGSVRIESAYLSDKLAHAFKKRDSVNYEDPGMRWLNSLGNDIFCHGERLITIAHLWAHNTEKHWIAVDVDGPKRMLRYGDSFGEEIPPLLRAAFEWWASKHGQDPLIVDTLSSSMQTDGHSCGIFAPNAAEHSVYPESPLIKQDDVVLVRLTMFNRLANRILDRIADAEQEDSDGGIAEPMEIISLPRSFAKVAHSAAFTFQHPRSADSTQSRNLKRPKDHPDGPTPNASPEKKRVREVNHDRSPPPLLHFDTSPLASTSHDQTMPHSDVFGVIHSKLSTLSDTQQSGYGLVVLPSLALLVNPLFFVIRQDVGFDLKGVNIIIELCAE
ncbi:hypothetical protein B0H10DRAFT_2244616 [Mycena sp. CBHHK59/15]|nr:hypothetical protein B0H10DRAFT_2244616 [Mycena sp. CBHHK59/15]